ncbi:Plastocyanin, chloroplastic [Linum grandiflorum]
MATLSSAAVSISSFTGLKASPKPTTVKVSKFCVRASMKDVGIAMVATAATAILASNAMAVEVLLGSDDGALAFVPSGVDVAKISMSEEDLLNAPGETYKVALTEKGEYSFYCSPHQGAGMVGKVTVN